MGFNDKNLHGSSLNYERGHLVGTASAVLDLLYADLSGARFEYLLNQTCYEFLRQFGNISGMQINTNDIVRDLQTIELLARTVIIMGEGFNPEMKQ